MGRWAKLYLCAKNSGSDKRIAIDHRVHDFSTKRRIIGNL
jgi:hypothetical protein